MNLLEQTKGSLQGLNAALRSEGDAARARYVSVEPDHDYFESLYILRHLADYDHDYSCTKLDASSALGRAHRAIDSLASARKQCPEQLDILGVAALADDRGRRQISKR